MDYKDTLNLPATDFPMKANLPVKEQEISTIWEEKGIYSRIIESRKGKKKYVLHDGPPYANGVIHMGHALNKSLKDFVVKYKTLKGYEAPYVPGWDCHGLPIELAVAKQLEENKEELSLPEFRRKCRNYALKFVEKQKKEFIRLGVFGDWENPYLTMTPDYEAGIVTIFKKLATDGYVFRQKKPVYWCADCRTALAEAEIEYEDHTSPSIYVKFEDTQEKGTYFVIWTTTPWTLPANVAIALHPDFTYIKVLVGSELWIVGEALWDAMQKDTGVTGEVVTRITGKELEGRTTQHPFIPERKSAIVLADYVTDDAGTGCVHTAPGHGVEDYITGLKYGLPILNPVDDEGRYTDEFALMKGVFIYDANPKILDLLTEKNALIQHAKIAHSYPHCWRCKKPVIFRATEQWFVKVDHDTLRTRALSTIKKTEWIPSWGENRITGMMENRPDWCLSRQRTWGVPVPMFSCPTCKKYVYSEKIFDAVIAFVRQNGADGWFTHDESGILGELNRCPDCGGGLVKDTNILDVWFDSGASYYSVVEQRPELTFPADLYLEGSDQHRGWFHHALLLSVAQQNIAPFKTVLTHGFIVDGQGKKMSKSLGNGVDPQDIIKKYGADVLRLWVASEDYRNDMPISGEIVDRIAEAYRRIRNTFRFILGNLNGYAPSMRVAYNDMPLPDKYMMQRLKQLITTLEQAYESFEFHKVFHSVHSFCVDLSALYLDCAKSVLYAEATDSIARRSIQTVMWEIIHSMTIALSPIMPFTTEEVWGYIAAEKNKPESVHMAMWPTIDCPEDAETVAVWEKILLLREDIKKKLEILRKDGVIGHSLDSYVFLHSDNADMNVFLQKNASFIRQLCIVSGVFVEKKETMISTEMLPGVMLTAEKSPHAKCERCWEYSATIGASKTHPTLCARCAAVLTHA